MAITNSIQLHQSLPSTSALFGLGGANDHEKKSCSLVSLSSDFLLQLNGLCIQVRIGFPYEHTLVGKVLAVLIHADQSTAPEILFLEDGAENPDFLDSKHTSLIGVLGV